MRLLKLKRLHRLPERGSGRDRHVRAVEFGLRVADVPEQIRDLAHGARLLAFYMFHRSGLLCLERNMEYQGRKPEDCHFKEGDIVEMMDDETVTLGIVYQQPPTPAEIEEFRKERRE